MYPQYWYIPAAVITVLVNLPLLTVLLRHGKDSWGVIKPAPNQFLFIACFFTPATWLLHKATADWVAYAAAEEVAHWIWAYPLGTWILVWSLGLLVGIFAAWADDRLTFRGIYSLRRSDASKALQQSRDVLSFLTDWDETPKAQSLVRDVVMERRTVDALREEKIKPPEELEQTIEKTKHLRTATRQRQALAQGTLDPWIRIGDAIELASVGIVAFHFVAISASLLIIRLHLYRVGLPHELITVATVVFLGVALYLPWLGFWHHCLGELRYVTGARQPNLGGLGLAIFVLLNLSMVAAAVFAKKNSLKLLLDIVPVALALLPFVVAATKPPVARRWFGASVPWQTLLMMVLFYGVFLAIWLVAVVFPHPQ